MLSLELDAIQWHQKSRRTAVVDLGPEVIINKAGRISITRSAILRIGDEVPEAFQIGFIPEKSIVVLQAAAQKDPDAYKLSTQARSYSINAETFFKFRRLELPQQERIYTPSFDKERGIIYFSLNEPHPQGDDEDTKPRRGRPRKQPVATD